MVATSSNNNQIIPSGCFFPSSKFRVFSASLHRYSFQCLDSCYRALVIPLWSKVYCRRPAASFWLAIYIRLLRHPTALINMKTSSSFQRHQTNMSKISSQRSANLEQSYQTSYFSPLDRRLSSTEKQLRLILMFLLLLKFQVVSSCSHSLVLIRSWLSSRKIIIFLPSTWHRILKIQSPSLRLLSMLEVMSSAATQATPARAQLRMASSQESIRSIMATLQTSVSSFWQQRCTFMQRQLIKPWAFQYTEKVSSKSAYLSILVKILAACRLQDLNSLLRPSYSTLQTRTQFRQIRKPFQLFWGRQASMTLSPSAPATQSRTSSLLLVVILGATSSRVFSRCNSQVVLQCTLQQVCFLMMNNRIAVTCYMSVSGFWLRCSESSFQKRMWAQMGIQGQFDSSYIANGDRCGFTRLYAAKDIISLNVYFYSSGLGGSFIKAATQSTVVRSSSEYLRNSDFIFYICVLLIY